MLRKTYGARFHESYDTFLDESVVYIGPHHLTDEFDLPGPAGTETAKKSTLQDRGSSLSIGNLLLSPTRTFAPLLKLMLENHFEKIHGLVHCSGGGQTKCLKYMPPNVRIIKDNLFAPPPVFRLIQQASKADDREMYQVYNMGTRMEIYVQERDAESMIQLSGEFGIGAQVIGRVEEHTSRELVIKAGNGKLVF
jgi:phosphoribosylformylglycinamidine cyclo-ligase